MAERMRSEPRDAGPHGRLLERSPHPGIGYGQSTNLHMNRKDPITLGGKRCGLPPGVHDLEHLGVCGHLLLGLRRFDTPNPLTDDSSLDQ